jgi:hypothetical protein
MTTTAPIVWNTILVEQIDWHWTNQLRPRLDSLADDEYFWEPTPGAWNVRRRDADSTSATAGSGRFTIDFEYPEPKPVPVTTIAWRLAHIIIGVLGARVHSHFGGPAVDYDTFDYAGTAREALAQLDQGYAAWIEGVKGWGEAGLADPCGPAEGPWAEHSHAELVTHINRELIHHGAEIALLRDLWAHRAD